MLQCYADEKDFIIDFDEIGKNRIFGFKSNNTDYKKRCAQDDDLEI